MRTLAYILSGLFIFAALACQKSGGSSTPAPHVQATPAPAPAPTTDSMKTYEFREFNGCTTGFHKLDSQQDYCSALLNDPLNNNCAFEMRRSTYEAECNSTGGVGGEPGKQTLSKNGNAAYCYMTGLDQGAQGLFDNRTISNQRFISWDGKKLGSFNISALLPEKYGRVRLILRPATATSAALAEILVAQEQGKFKYSAMAQFNSQLNLQVSSDLGQKKVTIECEPESSFGKNIANLNRISCQVNKDRPVQINWNTKNLLSTNLKASHVGRLSVNLVPATNQKDAQIEISAKGVGAEHEILARAAVRSGLSIKHFDRETGTQVQVVCSAASR